MIEAGRIVIPDLFAGVWDASVVSTYGADLHFFERDLLRQMDRIGNRVVLADNTQINRSFSRGPQARQLHQVNRTYLLAPIRVAQAAHVKFIMMLNGIQGLLAVGSGNLSMSGYASQGEIFTIYHYTSDDKEFLPAFLAVKEYLDGLGSNGNIDSVAREQLQRLWVAVPWIYKATKSTNSPVLHNLSRSFLDQLVEQLGGRSVDELVLHAPFYDRECRALERLLSSTNPRKLVLLVQERVTSVDPSKLEDVIASSGVDVDLRSVSASESGVMIHAKFIIAKCGDRAVCLQGSPNMSTVAMSLHQPQGNLEMANLLEGHREAFDHLMLGLNMSGESVNLAAMDLRLVESQSDEAGNLGEDVVRELSWIAPVVSGRFASVVLEPPTMIVGDEIAADVEWRLEDPMDGETSFRILLGERSATAISRNCAIVFGFSDDSFTVPTFPYHRKSLAALHSGQPVTDLLTLAADFDVEDGELERLLRQLDDVLVVDSRSLWRIVEGPSAITSDDDIEDGPHYDYSDIDWTAILNHPKLIHA